MEWMKISNLLNMKYCKRTTLSHPIHIAHPDCRCSIRDIIIAEGGCELICLFSDEDVINIDRVEKKLAQHEHRQQRPTMDIAFGISTNGRNCKIVLVDFKYKLKSFNRISKLDLVAKVQGTIDILGNVPCIFTPYLFVVQSNLLQEGRSYLSHRLFRNSPRLNKLYRVVDNITFALFWSDKK